MLMMQMGRRNGLLSLALALFLSALGTSVSNVALPHLTRIFAVEFAQVQWVVLAYVLAVTLVVVGVGQLSDRFGAKPVLLVGLLVFSLASVGCAVAPNLAVLIASRAVQGLGAAAMMTISLAQASQLVDPSKTGSVLGMLASVSATGTAIGPTLGGVLIEWLGWRAIFAILAPFAFGVVLLAMKTLPPSARSEKRRANQRMDWVGSILLSLALLLFCLALTGPAQMSWRMVFMLGLAGLILLVLVWHEKRIIDPLLPSVLWSDKSLLRGFIANWLVLTVVMTSMVVGPFYLSHGLGLPVSKIGLIMSIGPVGVALSGAWVGRLTDRWGAHCTVVIGLIVMSVGCLLFTCLRLEWRVVGYLIAIIGVTLGYAMFQTANTTAVLKQVAREQRGVFSGLLNLSRNLGMLTGASLMGSVFVFATGTQMSQADPAAVLDGLRVTYGFAMGCMLALIGLTLFYDRRLVGGERFDPQQILSEMGQVG